MRAGGASCAACAPSSALALLALAARRRRRTSAAAGEQIGRPRGDRGRRPRPEGRRGAPRAPGPGLERRTWSTATGRSPTSPTARRWRWSSSTRDSGEVARVVDRLPGRLEDGPRLLGRLRPQAQRPLRLPAALRDLPARPARLAPAAGGSPTSTSSSCSASASPTSSSTGPRSASRCRSSTRCSSTCSAAALWIGFRGRGEGLRPVWPAAWLLVAALFLIGFRVGLNVADSGAIDVGYASVVGADRIAHGEPIYDNFPEDVSQGDTYGPVNYYAYVPFERIWPWSGSWDDLPAAHGAAVVFDLATFALLILLGIRDPPRTGRPPPRRDPRLRLGRLPLHRLRPRVELQRHPGRDAPGRDPAASSPARSPAARSRRSRPSTKFAPALLAPMLLTYRPRRRRDRGRGLAAAPAHRRPRPFVAGFVGRRW